MIIMAEEKEKKKEKKKFRPYKKLKSCPKCGSGTRLAEHADRFSCGKCGYMELRRG